MPAPIAFFAYNRPDHAKAALDALMACPEAQESEIWLFSDGPKADASQVDLDAINAVRDLIKELPWPGSKQIILEESNKGLARSICEGISNILATHEQVIVVEDDLEVGKGFLTYLNSSLEAFATQHKVMHISAYVPPIVPTGLPSTFFYNQASCWGWATWKRAWSALNTDAQELKDSIEARGLTDYFNIDGSYNFMKHLEKNIDGRLNTWAIKWQASVNLAGGFCLHPSTSLVSNTGVDGSGAHMKTEEAEGRQKADGRQ